MKKQKHSMKGQITIFLALVFMVLFSLFGMTISLGMFVHDKINLQNSTDLASYYVATKQAEMLTAIAHSNYQIRQSWKLAAFRFRNLSNGSRTDQVLGANPLINIHPGLYNTPLDLGSDSGVYPPAKGASNPDGTFSPPRVCIAAGHMFSELGSDNLCKRINFSQIYIANIPSIIPIAAVGAVNDLIDQSTLEIQNSCAASGYINWWFANTILGSHKLEQRDRRAVINVLAENLARPIVSGAGGMRALDGGNIFDGALKTFRYNLSESNREDEDSVLQIQNSMLGLSPEDWLVPIYINAILPVSFLRSTTAGCAETLATHLQGGAILDNVLTTQTAITLKERLDPDEQVAQFGSIGGSSDSLMNLSLGVEKNPWHMVYNKVTASANSKPLFLSRVLGSSIAMRSIAYSKPFGGRIGPWYTSQWNSGSSQSDGGERSDLLVPLRVQVGDLGNIPADQNFEETLWPNASRYPGDEDGFTTRSAMGAYGRIVGAWYTLGNPGPTVPAETSVVDYRRATYSYFSTDYNDPLAQDVSENEPWDSFNRRLEIAAIAPDAFDMTYYTIVPGFYDYFIKDRLDQWLQDELPQFVELRGDIGAHKDGPAGINNFDIRNQMGISTITETEDQVSRRREAPWLYTESNTFTYLTSWIPGRRVMNYDAADQPGVRERFGNCAAPVVEGRVGIPSECRSGGRSGYSVKIISRDYLQDDHPIGGGGASGQILNIL